MTTLSITKANLSRTNAKGAMRNAFDRLIEARHLQARRYLSNLSVKGYDQFDLADADRRSLFDAASPERS